MGPIGLADLRNWLGLGDPFHFPAERLRRIVGPTKDPICCAQRKHWLVLVFPIVVVVVGSGFALLSAHPRFWLGVFAVGLTLVSKRKRRWSEIKTGIFAGVWLVPLVLTAGAPTPVVRVAGVVVLVAYLAVVAARWWFEILVLTNTSLWKLSGVITTASPKAPLSQILFQDVRQNILEQQLKCGTLDFDTAGASDKPLSHFGPIKDPFAMSAQIDNQRRTPPESKSNPPATPAQTPRQ